MELPYLRPLKIYMVRMKQAPSCERVRSISCSVEQSYNGFFYGF